MAYTAGEFQPGARIQKVTATADIAKGAVVTITPAAAPTAATCAEAGDGPFAVAIESIANGATGRVVTKGGVAVDCSGNCYGGAVVTGSGGKAKVCSTDPSENWIKPLGRMIVGAATGVVGVVDVGGF
ncbi:MAG: hypothetical protein WC343_08755 [Bacilli bacterium]|jgi:hypothetical protein